MKIKDLKLEFLWAKNSHKILGATDPFWEKWDPEWLKYKQFIQEEPLGKVIELLIISFKDQYPRDYWFTNLSVGMEAVRNIKVEGDYQLSENQYLVREDMVRYKWIERFDEQEYEYYYERIFEFKDVVNLDPAVEEALSGKVYSKNMQGSSTLYRVEDSPIAEIEVAPKSFRLTINEDFYVWRSL